MLHLRLDYASPSALVAEGPAASLCLSGDRQRPLRCVGRVRREVFPLRLALRTLGEAIWSAEGFAEGFDLDPIVTVHPDRIFFEAFSQDQGAYACLSVDLDLLELEGPLETGTTNIDFTSWLWAALGELRTSRATTLRIGGEGLTLATEGFGGRFERRVELPDDWVRGLLNVQAAMALPGTRLSVAPVDLLAALRFLQVTKARMSPRALRYELLPGQDARLVLEPWEEIIPLVGATHSYTEPRTIRTWGRQRLRLLEKLLPFADAVTVYLKGRAMPSFYAVDLPGISFLLGVTGFLEQAWHRNSLALVGRAAVDEAAIGQARDHLAKVYAASDRELAGALGWDLPKTAGVLQRLGRRGLVFYDLPTRRYRHRELFAERLDEARFFPPDPVQQAAQRHFAQGKVQIARCEPEENRKLKRFRTPDGGRVDREVSYRNWRVAGAVAEERAVELVLDDGGRLIFGRCGCAFFKDHQLSRGPCEHLLALLLASEGSRQDLPSSVAVDPAEAAALRQAKSRLRPDEKDEDDTPRDEDKDDDTEDDEDER